MPKLSAYVNDELWKAALAAMPGRKQSTIVQEGLRLLTGTPAEKHECGDDECERANAFSHYGGEASGLEEASGRMTNRAVAAFKAGDDKRANDFRDAADELTKRAIEVRAQQQEYK